MPSRNDVCRWLAHAARVGQQGVRRGWGGPFGAVIIYKGKILASACNTVWKDKDATCHAEINAIRAASRKCKKPILDRSEIYSTTEPCPMCFSAIHWARIRRIYYSTTIEDVKKLGFNELSISNRLLKKWGKSPVSINRIREKTAVELLKFWSRMPHKKTY